MAFELEKQLYDQHGFVIVRQLLPEKDFTELKQNLDRYIRDVVPGLPDGDAFYQDRSRPETLKQMQRMGCDRGQGYFYARPMSHADLLGWLSARATEVRVVHIAHAAPGTRRPVAA